MVSNSFRPKPKPTAERFKAKVSQNFGKTWFELDLAGESGEMLASEDPLRYVFHMLSYMHVTNPTASELKETNRHVDGLPRFFKSYFVCDASKAVHDFTEREKRWRWNTPIVKVLWCKLA